MILKDYYKSLINKLETVCTVSWFLMDFCWMNDWLDAATGLGSIAIIGCLFTLRTRIVFMVALLRNSFSYGNEEEKDNSIGICYEIAAFCWLSMNFLWMLELPGKNIAFGVGAFFILLTIAWNVISGSSWTTPFSRFRMFRKK